MSDIAIKVENLSKRYRIGLKEELHDTFAGALTDFLRQSVKNMYCPNGLFQQQSKRRTRTP